MRASEPLTQTIKASEARQQFSRLLNQVFRKETRVIVEKSGIPVAALISTADLDRLTRFERERAARFLALDASRAAFQGVPDEELEQEVGRAVAEARQELGDKRASLPFAAWQRTLRTT
jgi:prevent-host-death family protein